MSDFDFDNINWALQNALQANIDTQRLTDGTLDLEEINGHVGNLNDQVDDLNSQVVGLNGQVSVLNGQVGGLNSTVSDINGKVSVLKEKVSDIGEKVSAINGKVSALHGTVSDLQQKVKLLESGQEQDRINAQAELERTHRHETITTVIAFCSLAVSAVSLILSIVR